MIVRWIGGLVITGVLVLMLLLAFLLDTTPGARWLLREIELFSERTVRFDDVSGTFADGLRIGELVIDAGDARISGQAVTLRLSPAQLLRGHLVIAALVAERVEVLVSENGDGATPSDEPFTMPVISTPLPIDLQALDIASLGWGRESAPAMLSRLHLSATMRGTSVELRELRGEGFGAALRLSGTVDLVPELPLDARVQWRLAEPALSGAGWLRGDLQALRMEQFLQLPDAVHVTAVVSDVAGELRAEVAADWNALRIEVPQLGQLRASQGSLTLAGTVQDWQARLSSDVQGDTLPLTMIRGAARGSAARIVFEALRLEGDAGTIMAKGDLDFAAGARLRLDIDVTDLDVNVLHGDLAGRLAAQARLDARLPGEIDITIVALDGQVIDRPLSGSGTIGLRSGVVNFRDVALRAGANRLQADGSLGQQLAGRFELDAPELGVLWPTLTGSVRAQAALSGTPARPVIALEARAADLVLDGYRLHRVELGMQVDRQQQAEVRLEMAGIDIAGNAIGDLDARLQGSVTDHRLQVELSGGVLEATLASAGGWDGKTLRHAIERATVAEESFGEWRLADEPVLALRVGAVDVGAHCWEQPPASLCIESLAWSAQRTHIVGQLREFDLGRFDRWLPKDLAMVGRAAADVSLELTPATTVGRLQWRQDGTTVYYTGGDEPLETVLETARATVEFSPREMLATLEIDGPQGVALSGSGRMDMPLGADAPFDLELSGVLPDIGPLLPLLAADIDVADVAGRIAVDVAVGGNLREPEITGVARLSEGAIAFTDVGIKFEGIDIALLGDGSPVLRLQGLANAGGRVTLAGEFSPFEEVGPGGFVRIRGNNIDAVRLPDRFVKASPDMTVRYAAGQISVDGEVTIPRADIVVRELPEAAVSPSADTVVMDREAVAAVAPGQIIGGELALNLGRDVRLRGFGLDTRLTGTLKLSQGPDGTPQGFGVVRLVDGQFGAYGKELVIERGTLGFTGPLDDPAVNLRAVRQVEWEGQRVTAGILVSGTTSRPQSRIFSEPAMSEADALSYLISGRPLQSTAAGDRSAIAGAALALGVQQTSPITDRIGSAITLDELGLQGGGSLDETEIVAGKQLGSDLYVRFSYGLFSRIGTVLARYRLGRNVSIEAASGEDQSLDLIYSIERR